MEIYTGTEYLRAGSVFAQPSRYAGPRGPRAGGYAFMARLAAPRPVDATTMVPGPAERIHVFILFLPFSVSAQQSQTPNEQHEQSSPDTTLPPALWMWT